MITSDGKEVQKGDKVWTHVQDGWHEVTVGEPYPWAPKFIVKPRYCYSSKEARFPFDGITAVLAGGTELWFDTLNHQTVHEHLRKMGLKDDNYTIHFRRKSE